VFAGLLYFDLHFHVDSIASPFTYFFLYPYGVVSRPYSLLLLGMILAAMAYGTASRIGTVGVALALVCNVSFFGILLHLEYVYPACGNDYGIP
jgi:hypothetical protein